MSKSRLIKKILFIYVIAILVILSPYKVQADEETSSEEFYVYDSESGTWIEEEREDGEIEVISYIENENNTSGSESINADEYEDESSMTHLSSFWYALCCEHGSDLEDDYNLLFKNYGTYIANPCEAYMLSTLDETNEGDYYTDVQDSWWLTYIGQKVFETGNAGTEHSIFTVGQEFQSYIFDVIEEEDLLQEEYIYDTYSSYYETYALEAEDGTSIEVEAINIDDDIEFEFVDDKEDTDGDGEVEGDGSTYEEDGDEEDKYTVSFDYDDNAYKIGPFVLNYTEAYSSVADESSDDSGIVLFAGVVGVYLETNLEDEELVFGEDYWFEYTDEASQSEVTGMPSSGKVFYLCVKYKEGMTRIMNLKFLHKYMNAGGQVVAFMSYCWKCNYCGGLMEWGYDEKDDFGNVRTRGRSRKYVLVL